MSKQEREGTISEERERERERGREKKFINKLMEDRETERDLV
jgi:hypothetical protein